MLVRGTGFSNIEAVVGGYTDARHTIIRKACGVSIASKADRTLRDTQVVAAELIVIAVRVFHTGHTGPNPRVAMRLSIGRLAMGVGATGARAHVAHKAAALVGLTCGMGRARGPGRPFWKTRPGVAIVSIAPFNAVCVVIAGAGSDRVTRGVDDFFAIAALTFRVARAQRTQIEFWLAAATGRCGKEGYGCGNVAELVRITLGIGETFDAQVS